MTLLEFATLSLNISAFSYLAASIVFFLAVAKSGSSTAGRWTGFGIGLVLLSFALHTAGLGARWVIGGIGRPPWTNLYESLIFFSWGVTATQIYAQSKWKLPLLGAVSMPFVFVLMGMAVMTPNKSVEPLIPALQSYWLKIHVVFGMISYAGFTTAACLGFLHLLKNKVSLSKIGAALALVAIANLFIAGGREVFDTGHFYMAKTAVRSMPDGQEVRTKDTYREYEGGPVITRMEVVPHAHYFFHFSVLCFLLSSVMFISRKRQATEGPDDLGPGFTLFSLGFAGMLGLFAAIAVGVKGSPTLTLHSNPYLVLLLLLTFFFCAFYMLGKYKGDAFLATLPSAERLDELGYKNILFAFPFQTLLLITGAIWAYYAWGRAWGWDPKEVGALITWFAYLIYLHGKLLMNWKPNLLSVISLIGFVILIFAFLGVNLVLSGLHSYGAA